MARIALFHSVLGPRPGLLDGAERLRAAGHDVTVVDQYDGRTFDDYEAADAFARSLGYPVLMASALDAVAGLADGFVAAGFSNGGGMAHHVAQHRDVAGVVAMSGALPPSMLGADTWPAGVAAQLHYTVDDPFRDEDRLDETVAAIRAAGAPLELFLDYPGAGHLFTDASLPEEFDATSTELLWPRVLAFVDRVATD